MTDLQFRKPPLKHSPPLPIPHPETVAIWFAIGGEPAIDVIVEEAVVGPPGIGLARPGTAEVLLHRRFLVLLLDDLLLFLLHRLSRFDVVDGHDRRDSGYEARQTRCDDQMTQSHKYTLFHGHSAPHRRAPMIERLRRLIVAWRKGVLRPRVDSYGFAPLTQSRTRRRIWRRARKGLSTQMGLLTHT